MSKDTKKPTDEEEIKYYACLSNIDEALSNSDTQISEKEARKSYSFASQYEKDYPQEDNKEVRRERYIKALNICISEDKSNPNYKLAQQIVNDYTSEMYQIRNLKLKSENVDYDDIDAYGRTDTEGNITLSTVLENPVDINATALHENKHRIDIDFGLFEFELADLSARFNRTTENLANVTEYLYVAEQYQLLKKAGVETFAYIDNRGKQHELELDDILQQYPGLKECLDKGFDPQNPKDVERVVKAASAYWHDERQKGYDQQAVRAGLATSLGQQKKTFSELLKEEKLYEEIENRMLKSVYTGYRSYDLSAYKDMLNPMSSEEAIKLFDDHSEAFTSNHLKKLNAVFDEKKIDPQNRDAYYQALKDDLLYKNGTSEDNLNQKISNSGKETLKSKMKGDAEKAKKIMNEMTTPTSAQTADEHSPVAQTQNPNSVQTQMILTSARYKDR